MDIIFGGDELPPATPSPTPNPNSTPHPNPNPNPNPNPSLGDELPPGPGLHSPPAPLVFRITAAEVEANGRRFALVRVRVRVRVGQRQVRTFHRVACL